MANKRNARDFWTKKLQALEAQLTTIVNQIVVITIR
jgi:hypothetical protein